MKKDTELEQIRKRNLEFKSLEEEHLGLEKELSGLLRRRTLTPEEELQKKGIQKRKLAIKDRMEEILREIPSNSVEHRSRAEA